METRLYLTFSLLIACGCLGLHAQTTQIVYLSGTDKDHTVNWDFFINTGQKSGSWKKIAVPSNWELQGFGTYNYFQDTKTPTNKACTNIISILTQHGLGKRYSSFLKE